MSNEEGSYAPKSPDLSSFYAGGPDPGVGARPPHHPGVGYSPYQQHPPQNPPPPTSVPAATYLQPQPHPPHPPPQAYQTDQYTNFNQYTTQASRPPSYYSVEQQPPYSPAAPQTAQPPYGLQAPTQQHPAYYPAYPDHQPDPYQLAPQLAGHGPPPPQLSIAHEPLQQQSSFDPMPPRKAAQLAQPPEIMASPVRTKFPTARIKRIMQADEEVGKVAQQTPIAVGKALELFMVQIVSKSADVAKEKNSKRISAQMLKQAVATNPQWDFLQDIVSKVSEKEEAPKAGKSKAESESEEEFDPGEAKKKGRGGGRKKKVPS